MSTLKDIADVAILEGDKSKYFSNVQRLRTDSDNGDIDIWIPEGVRKFKKIRITENGTYKVSDYTYQEEYTEDEDSATMVITKKYFAFSKVTVAVKGKSVIGKKRKDPLSPDPSSDNEYEVGVDDSGDITEEVVPSKIKITKKPDKLNYVDKQSINPKGIVVKAYLNDGTIWDATGYSGGVIPLKELDFSPQKVDIDKILPPDVNYPSYEDEGDYTITSLGNPMAIIENSLARMHKFEDKCGLMDAIHNLVANYPNSPFTVNLRTNHDNFKGWSPLNITVFPDLKKGDEIRAGGRYRCVYIATYAGEKKTLEEPWVFEKYSIDDTGYKERLDIGFRKYYEDETGYDVYTCSIDAIVEKEGGQEITVKWARPQDGKELTDKFRVSVNKKKDNDNNNDNGEYEGYPTH